MIHARLTYATGDVAVVHLTPDQVEASGGLSAALQLAAREVNPEHPVIACATLDAHDRWQPFQLARDLFRPQQLWPYLMIHVFLPSTAVTPWPSAIRVRSDEIFGYRPTAGGRWEAAPGAHALGFLYLIHAHDLARLVLPFKYAMLESGHYAELPLAAPSRYPLVRVPGGPEYFMTRRTLEQLRWCAENYRDGWNDAMKQWDGTLPCSYTDVRDWLMYEYETPLLDAAQVALWVTRYDVCAPRPYTLDRLSWTPVV